MQNTFSEGPILLPLALDKSDKELNAIEFAFWLAATFKRALHVVHAIPNWGYIPTVPGLRLTVPTMSGEIEEAEKAISQALLSFTSNSLYSDVALTIRAYYGEPAAWICAESAAASLTVISTYPSQKGILRKFGTAFKIMNQCRGPIAVVPSDCEFSFPMQNMRLLVADDLESHTSGAVEFAGWFASRFKRTELNHVHVTPITTDVLERSIQLALAQSNNSGESYPDLQTLVEKMMKDLKEKMADRFRNWQAEFGLTNTQYKPWLMQGHPSDMLHMKREGLQLDIEIYGQHRAYHGNAFGKIPFETMLSATRPIIIVP